MSLETLHQYFRGEEQGAWVAAALGAASLVFGWYLWSVRSPFRAMAWPLLVIGFAEIGLGVGLLVRTGPQVQALEERFASGSQGAAATELQRMTRVNRSFRVIQIVEVIVMAFGVALALLFRTRDAGWAAFGMGLFLQAAVLLVFDMFAEHRALAYTRWLTDVARS